MRMRVVYWPTSEATLYRTHNQASHSVPVLGTAPIVVTPAHGVEDRTAHKPVIHHNDNEGSMNLKFVTIT